MIRQGYKRLAGGPVRHCLNKVLEISISTERAVVVTLLTAAAVVTVVALAMVVRITDPVAVGTHQRTD